MLRECSQELNPGDIIAIIQVRLLSPINESLKTCVSLDALKGKWAPFIPNALMHSFNASNDLLISAPSIPVIFFKLIETFINYTNYLSNKNIVRVCLLAEDVSAPRSLPAKSINENFPCTL